MHLSGVDSNAHYGWEDQHRLEVDEEGNVEGMLLSIIISDLVQNVQILLIPVNKESPNQLDTAPNEALMNSFKLIVLVQDHLVNDQIVLFQGANVELLIKKFLYDLVVLATVEVFEVLSSINFELARNVEIFHSNFKFHDLSLHVKQRILNEKNDKFSVIDSIEHLEVETATLCQV